MDQYMEPVQDGAQDDQIISTEVPATDRAVYRISPRKSGKELRLEPRPDDRTEARLPRTTRQTKTDDLGRAGTKLAHEPYPTDCPDRAATVLLLTAKESLGSAEPGR
ncbi:hypothetical protein DY000_02016868 [Brassica cretica]|uniref:Uncharacterized protein n=1 Tax=Brassica cretica TaxID=69181 RepID=A0ABQ7D4H3_BRACR|nr:hypothetical protein DY000_02016868 [Brassica cretica]